MCPLAQLARCRVAHGLLPVCDSWPARSPRGRLVPTWLGRLRCKGAVPVLRATAAWIPAPPIRITCNELLGRFSISPHFAFFILKMVVVMEPALQADAKMK